MCIAASGYPSDNILDFVLLGTSEEPLMARYYDEHVDDFRDPPAASTFNSNSNGIRPSSQGRARVEPSGLSSSQHYGSQMLSSDYEPGRQLREHQFSQSKGAIAASRSTDDRMSLGRSLDHYIYPERSSDNAHEYVHRLERFEVIDTPY
jgi:hypothetical protein